MIVLQAGVDLRPVDIRRKGPFGGQLLFDDLTGEEHRAFRRVAVQGGDKKPGPEGIPGTRRIDDIYGTGRYVGCDPATLGDQIPLLAHGEDDGLSAEIVEHLDVLLGLVVRAEDTPR